MASIASLVSLGSVCACSSEQVEGSFSHVHRVSFSRNFLNFRRIWVLKRRHYVSVCRYSVTDYAADQGTLISLRSMFEGTKDDADSILKPAPKPQLKSGQTDEPLLGMSSGSLNGSTVGTGFHHEEVKRDNEEKNKVIESIGEVLEEAEKPETSNNADASVKKQSGSLGAGQKNCKPLKLTRSPNQKSKTLKSVWRKGDPVANVRNAVKEPSKQDQQTNGKGKIQPQSVSSVRLPRPPQKVQPKLQGKPSVVTSAVKKPVILKDLGAAVESPAHDRTDLLAKPKERKPILIDKFASKKTVVDPLNARAVLAPSKRRRSPPSGKLKDEFREEGDPSGGPRRRKVKDDDEIPDEETSGLGVSFPGAATARKGRKWTKASRKAAKIEAAKEAAPVRVEVLEVGDKGMSTEELSHNLVISEGEILGYLYTKKIKPDGVQTLSRDMVKMICKEYDVEVIDAVPVRVEEMAKKKEMLDEDDLDKLEERPPVLTIMGHVDHGKTTLLDYIRKSKVTASEAGGITQGIGAYKVQVPIDGKSQTCVFLDTPGHEAFGAMRARGARVTDIAIIVVAADDGIQPQTHEAVAHAKAAGVPIIIAINKIDKDGANAERVMQDISSIGLMPDDWGGDTPMVKISALKGENVGDLLEMVMLVSELQELKANPHRNAKGTVIEAGLDKAKGPLATFIVQNGTLKKRDIVVCGEALGKVRALFDDNGKGVEEAGPSIPVQVIGLNKVPFAGDEFEVVGSLDVAREKAESCSETLRNEHISTKAGDGKVTLSSFAYAVSARKHTGLDLHQLNIILKVDVQGSIEAVRQALHMLPQDNVTLKFLLQATGGASTSDVDLAVASNAIIFGFNVRAPGSVKKYANQKGVEIRLYKVIYELIDDVRNAMEGLLEPVEEHVPIGLAEVRAVFRNGSSCAAGCMVTEGQVAKHCSIRVIRKGKEVHVGLLDSLRRVKENMKEVTAGLECGIVSEEFDDWEAEDLIEAFKTVEKRRTLEEASDSMAAALEEAGVEL